MVEPSEAILPNMADATQMIETKTEVIPAEQKRKIRELAYLDK
jgi:hypothetical protein